jgi:hypothetical protein
LTLNKIVIENNCLEFLDSTNICSESIKLIKIMINLKYTEYDIIINQIENLNKIIENTELV